MARIAQVDVIDNGIIIQSDPRVDGREGIEVYVTRDEALNRFAQLLDAKIAEKGVKLADVVLPNKKSPEAPTKSDGPPIEFKTAEPTQGVEPPDAVENADDYEAELRRLVDDNDRDAAHARLKDHVDAGYIDPYNPRLGIKNLVDLIRQGDKAKLPVGAEPEETTTTASSGTLPSGAPLPPGVPPPTGHDPFAVEVTVQDVSAALQAAAKRTDAATAFGVLKAVGATKVTDLESDQYAGVIAAANAL